MDHQTVQGMRTKMTVDVDVRTAGKIIDLGLKWNKGPGEVIDSLMRNFIKHLKEDKSC